MEFLRKPSSIPLGRSYSVTHIMSPNGFHFGAILCIRLGPVLLLQFNPAVTCNCLHGAPSCNMPTLRALYFWLRRQETISSLVVNNSTSRQYHAQCPISCQYLAKYCRCIYLSFHSGTFKDLRFFYHKIIIDHKYLIGIWVREVSSSTYLK